MKTENKRSNLYKVLEYIRSKDDFMDYIKAAPVDNMPYENYVILSSFQTDLSDKYINALETYLHNKDIGLGYSDEFVTDYDNNESIAYYTQCYHTGHNFIVGDGFIIGENSDLSYFHLEDIIKPLIYTMDGNIGNLPSNGNIFEYLVSFDAVHHIDLVQYCNQYNKYDCRDKIKELARNHPNYYFIGFNDMEVAAVRKSLI